MIGGTLKVIQRDLHWAQRPERLVEGGRLEERPCGKGRLEERLVEKGGCRAEPQF